LCFKKKKLFSDDLMIGEIDIHLEKGRAKLLKISDILCMLIEEKSL